MSHEVETIAVGDRHRITVHADLDAECPRIIGDPATGAYTHTASPYTDVPEGPDDFNVTGVLEHFEGRLSWIHNFHEIAARWARIFHGVTIVDDGRTLWWVSPAWMQETYPNLAAGTPKYLEIEQEVIAADQREYQQWADGNVYGVVVERTVDWNRIGPGEPDRLTTWEDVAAVWGVYFDGDYPTHDEIMLFAMQDLDLDDAAIAAFSALNDHQEASA